MSQSPLESPAIHIEAPTAPRGASWQLVLTPKQPEDAQRLFTALAALFAPDTQPTTTLRALTHPDSVTGVSPRPLAIRENTPRTFALSNPAFTVELGLTPTPPSVTLTLPRSHHPKPHCTLWLQAHPDHPHPILALPHQDSGFTVDALHSLVGYANRIAPLARATVTSQPTGPASAWHFAPTTQAASLLIHPALDGALWLAPLPGDAPDTTPELWFESPSAPTNPTPPTWLADLDTLLSASPRSPDALVDVIRRACPDAPPLSLTPRPAATSAQPNSDTTIAALTPTEDTLVLHLDLTAPAATLRDTIIHLVGHLRCGHLAPGDLRAHVDTPSSITAARPHRRWDREARAAVADLRPTERRVTSLDECTPHEKAQLGLWRMIGEMLGESRQIHAEAERYQRAAYQRQAAQRIVSMLEDFGGAMLCDGVGLGKTYVATTVLVHYANLWRDQHAATPARLLEDPFRISVLSPRSVVSTWEREALPPLAEYGVPLASVRVLSHTQLSSLKASSNVLEHHKSQLSDLEHLLLSDLVIVDEAHNFRSLNAKRTKVLRDLLRLQPRKSMRRRVALLTATPINNSLEDLRQELSLIFSRPILLSDDRTELGYRKKAIANIQDRCNKARKNKPREDVAPLIVHGRIDAKFSDAIEFRDDLQLGPRVQRVGDYLKEQDKLLRETRDRIRLAAQDPTSTASRSTVRIAEELLDRVVVQRSRRLCKEIESQHTNSTELLFRPDAGPPEKLRYADEYDGTKDVLARFLPLFDTPTGATSATPPLSLKVYMWYDVELGLKSASESSSVVGLQRMLVLKRLESSPVAFLITLVRLAVLHAHRLRELLTLCSDAADAARTRALQDACTALLSSHDATALARLRTLATGHSPKTPRSDFLDALSKAYTGKASAADTDDPPPQLELFSESPETASKRESLDRLWPLHEALLQDFDTLLSATPALADIIFGSFDQAQWPKRLMSGGVEIDWPTSPEWGLRLVTDGKLRQLISRLLLARRDHQKIVVFSQFSDTIAYIKSVLAACGQFERQHWQMAVRGLDVKGLKTDELTDLIKRTTSITGDTDNRDDFVNAFAPFYRLGPAPPTSTDGESEALRTAWQVGWTRAIKDPLDVLIASDVLAEGVNLQDAALLINYDVHWNPVRMIQRAGRIDRRLNPKIEHPRVFPDLADLAASLGHPAPRYYWHDHPNEAPVTVNMILPDELEDELLLRERIATKTLAIDITLGLEQGTGAEADWMEHYKFQGVASLNALQKDRAIEQLGSYHERMQRTFGQRGIDVNWSENLNAWFRVGDANEGSPLIGRALLGRRGGTLERFSRYLEPTVHEGAPCWFWTDEEPGDSLFDGWLVLDGRPENFPPRPRLDIPYHEGVSAPVSATHLLVASHEVDRAETIEQLSSKVIGRPLLQGASALAAPRLGTDEDRRMIAIRDFYLLQLPRLTEKTHADP